MFRHALKAGLPPHDVSSFAWLSLEEAQVRLLQDLPPIEGEEARFFPGPLGPFWRALRAIPEPDLAEDPLYLFVQVVLKASPKGPLHHQAGRSTAPLSSAPPKPLGFPSGLP